MNFQQATIIDSDTSSMKCTIAINNGNTIVPKEIKSRSGRVTKNLIDLIFERRDVSVTVVMF